MKLISLIAILACLNLTIRASADTEVVTDLLDDFTPSIEAEMLQRAFCIPNGGVRVCYADADCCSNCCAPDTNDVMCYPQSACDKKTKSDTMLIIGCIAFCVCIVAVIAVGAIMVVKKKRAAQTSEEAKEAAYTPVDSGH